MIRKLLKDVVISLVVGIGKGAFRHILSKAKAVCFIFQSLRCKHNTAETFTVGKLSIHEDGELIIASEVLDILVAIILPHKVVEMVAIKEVKSCE